MLIARIMKDGGVGTECMGVVRFMPFLSIVSLTAIESYSLYWVQLRQQSNKIFKPFPGRDGGRFWRKEQGGIT